ncbi:acyltransferase [Alsobacter soli]|uniref:Acyltransferase n=1 Tax=Alsobacter soli TaxID=2109933 RepID=A0A2T1HRE2_9HYPH|nr:acyltransferase [Alsobacter soli]PSC04206.1 acyltransferase [Alsobacter soli]
MNPAPLSASKRNWGIQALRGVAATMVLAHHAMEESLAIPSFAGAPDWAVRWGAAGVDVFFVISGLVVFLAAFEGGAGRERGRTPSAFMRDRIQRIYPLYWACLALVLALWASGLGFSSLTVDPGKLLAAVFLLPHHEQVVGVAWTLVYEMYFYVLIAFALCIRLNQEQTALFTAGMILANWGAARLAGGHGAVASFLGDPIVFEFCYGIGLACLVGRDAIRVRRPVALAAVGGVLLLLASAFAPSETTAGLAPSARFAAWGIPAVLVVVGFSQMAIRPVGWIRGLVFLGAASYALYLTHGFVMISYARLIKHGHMPLGGVAGVVLACLAAFALASLAHIFVETPLSRLVKGALRRPKPMAAGASDQLAPEPSAPLQTL